MGALVEYYKGIEFVRISSMPKDQQRVIWESFEHEKIIKIIKEESLMNDCILFSDYSAWQANQAKTLRSQQPEALPSGPLGSPLRKLAFK